MSLGIEAGSKAVLITTDLDELDEEVTGTVYIAGSDFPTELPDLPVYVIGPEFPERLDGYVEGIYKFEGDTFLFEVGSYSRYNDWRAQLSRFALDVEPEFVWANPAAFMGKPFVEIVNFSDNEGAIGPKTSQKLAENFAAHSENFRRFITINVEDSEMAVWFVELYDNLRRAFELASDEGFVVFE